MIELNSRQRKLLEKEANTLSPVVMVGQAGVTDAVIKMTEDSLAVHELLKIKFLAFTDEKRELSESLADKCDAALVRIIGNITVLYRPADEVQKQKFSSKLAKLA